ncbi:unnamed protein product, partial [Polarella glacialis]
VCRTLLSFAARDVAAVTEEVLSNFVSAAAGGYLSGPQYHNFPHAVDVTHTLFMVIQDCGRGPFALMPRLDVYALLASAVCHDIGHSGLNNDFIAQTKNELAIRYNDHSPLENMHCATFFELLQDKSLNVFDSLIRREQKEVRQICIDAILHTDNTLHSTIVQGLKMFGEMNEELLNR